MNLEDNSSVGSLPEWRILTRETRSSSNRSIRFTFSSYFAHNPYFSIFLSLFLLFSSASMNCYGIPNLMQTSSKFSLLFVSMTLIEQPNILRICCKSWSSLIKHIVKPRISLSYERKERLRLNSYS